MVGWVLNLLGLRALWDLDLELRRARKREPEGGPGVKSERERHLGEAGSCQVSDTSGKSCTIRPESVY